MTDPSFDELASAHLDGVTTPEEAERVAADPALRARVEELRQVRDALAVLPPVDAARREAAIAAALAAFAEADGSAEGAPVTSLTAVAARRGVPRRALQVLGAAAAVALLVLLAPVLGRMGSSSDDEASFDSTGAAIEGGPESAPDEHEGAELDDGGNDAAPTTTVFAGLDLGAFDDLDALAAALTGPEHLSLQSGSTTNFETVDGAACPPPSPSEPTAATTTGAARATVADEAVVVVVQTTGDADTLLVYRAADCTLVAERPL